MLTEEKAVREWKNAAGVDPKMFIREVTALRRAVYEDCARYIETDGRGHCVTDPAAIALAGILRARGGKG